MHLGNLMHAIRLSISPADRHNDNPCTSRISLPFKVIRGGIAHSEIASPPEPFQVTTTPSRDAATLIQNPRNMVVQKNRSFPNGANHR
jgi:hypothetical protein